MTTAADADLAGRLASVLGADGIDGLRQLSGGPAGDVNTPSRTRASDDR
jgi:hypothetical protein